MRSPSFALRRRNDDGVNESGKRFLIAFSESKCKVLMLQKSEWSAYLKSGSIVALISTYSSSKKRQRTHKTNALPLEGSEVRPESPLLDAVDGRS